MLAGGNEHLLDEYAKSYMRSLLYSSTRQMDQEASKGERGKEK